MKPYEHRLVARDLAVNERNVLVRIDLAPVRDRLEVAERRLDARLCDPRDERLETEPIADERLDRDPRQIVLLREGVEIRAVRDRTVVAEDRTDDRRGRHSGKAREVDARFRDLRPRQDA